MRDNDVSHRARALQVIFRTELASPPAARVGGHAREPAVGIDRGLARIRGFVMRLVAVTVPVCDATVIGTAAARILTR